MKGRSYLQFQEPWQPALPNILYTCHKRSEGEMDCSDSLQHTLSERSEERLWVGLCPSELLDMTDSETGETALHKAACQRHRAICQLLVDAGASLRKTDSKGKTPRDRAQQAGDPDLASYLESRQNYQMVPHEDLETAV
uniref:Uncharacterized protein n=1 Tax=Phasianus colchicus TaxID=9054 RepID=A0A669P8A1_PHACC